MANLRKTTEVPVSAHRAWALVGRPDSISTWHPAIAQSSVDGNVRRCVLADGARIDEEIRHHDDEKRSYTYVITDSPLPLEDYVSTLRVAELAPDRCRIEWACTYEPLGPAADVEAMLAGVYEAGLAGAAAQLQG